MEFTKIAARRPSRRQWRPAARVAASLAILVLLGACARAVSHVMAHNAGADTACALDGMLLKDYPGPKGQIVYADGKVDFFCDLMEMFSVELNPEQKRPIAAMYTQDMAKTSWEHPEGHWIDARTAVYVVGSRKQGSMGPTFASFANAQEAQAFAGKEGGRLVHFDQVTPNMANLDGGVVHDEAMSH